MERKETQKIVRLFYERSPFLVHNLEKINSKVDLYNIATPFAKSLDSNIPVKTKILDLGCGAGVLAAFLSINKRKVVGVDFSRTSLNYARKLKKKLCLSDTSFIKSDVLNLKMPKETFDYTLCLGVLHHMEDPYAGFQVQCALTKKGGFLILGLYNTYGRLIPKLRKLFFKLSKGRWKKVDYFIRRNDMDEKMEKIWFEDQYEHPHESTHTIDEILNWFKKNNIEFINSIPKFEIFSDISLENLFNKNSERDEHKRKLLHFFVQLKWILTRSRDGGFFIIIGRKK